MVTLTIALASLAVACAWHSERWLRVYVSPIVCLVMIGVLEHQGFPPDLVPILWVTTILALIGWIVRFCGVLDDI